MADRDAASGNVTHLPVCRHAAAETVSPVGASVPATVHSRWPTARVAAVEALWGDGFTAPGGGPEALRLARPLGLSAEVTLLMLGDGLGGAARTICDSTGSWVAHFEANEALRTQLAARTQAQDRITVGEWDRVQPRFAPGSAHHVLAMEALRGAAPQPLLESLTEALHPGGQMVLTELVSDDASGQQDREFEAWCRLDDRRPTLPRSDEVNDGLRRLGWQVRVQEDVSDRHITQTLDGWRQAVRTMSTGPRPANHMAAAFVNEAELWLLRIRLMRRLGVRLMRWHAVAS